MKKLAAFTIILSMLCASPSHAQIMDIPEKILQIVNKVNDVLMLVEKNYQEYRKLKSLVKSGIMGSATVKMFKEAQKLYNTGTKLKSRLADPNVNVFYKLYDVLAAAEILNDSLETTELMYAQLEIEAEKQGANSKELAQLKKDDQQNIKNTIATLYARAIKTRYLTYLTSEEGQQNCKTDDEKIDEDSINFEDEGSILQAIRGVAKKTIERKSNVLFMEASMLEYNARKMQIALPTPKADEIDETPEKIDSSYEPLEDE